MIVAARDMTPLPGPDGAGNSAKPTRGAALDFSAVLSGKVNDRQASPSAGSGRARTAPATDGSPATVVNEPSRPDLLAQKLAARLNGGARNDDANETPPAAADAPSAGESAPVTTAQQADPALDSDAAAALMALLALTRPAAAASAANAAGSATDSGSATGAGAAVNGTFINADGSAINATIAGGPAINATIGDAANAMVSQGSDSAANAGAAAPAVVRTGGDAANNADVNPTTGGARDALTATASGEAATLASAIPAAGLLPAKTAGAVTPELKTAPATAATKGKPASTAADAGLTTAAAVPVDPALAAGAGSDRDGSDPTAVLILKKTTGIMSETFAPTPGATAPVTPTLSAADAAVTGTPTPSSALVSAQLGSDEWRQAIGQQVLMQLRNGQQNAELRLHPDNLGALRISLQMDGNNQAQIHMVSGHSQVRSALEDALPQLRASLAESGIQLGQSSVGSDATPGGGGTGQDAAGNARAASGFSIDAVAVNAGGDLAPASVDSAERAAGIDTFA
ncbi:flagellar hook-length control protein FliK [Acerihabitans sp.]|uniref:flagellar hook-length control protein FliK n=1 Tax=Acerihabitans sp. TaxID=2811394 RepID=UPI002ED87550